MRDRRVVAIVPFTFRTEGLVSELTFVATTKLTTNPELCYFRDDCLLEDSDGRTYPAFGPRFEFPGVSGARVFGTMRFIGQVPPDVTSLRLRIGGTSGFVTIGNPTLEHDFTRAEESELSVAASSTRPAPFDVGVALDDGSGLVVELGEISFADDRIQLEVTASASPESGWNLNRSGDSLIRDPSGFEHPLAAASGGGSLDVPAGDSVTATLVFLTPLDPAATELTLELHVARDHVLRHTIDLSAGGDTEEEDG